MTVSPGFSGLPDRTERGRFAPGNKLASGNPNARRAYELRSALLDAATPEKVKAVIAKLGDLAESGDVAAMKLWLAYAVGPPVQGIELSGMNSDEPFGGIAGFSAIVLEALAPAEFDEARWAVGAAIMKERRDQTDTPEQRDGDDDTLSAETSEPEDRP